MKNKLKSKQAARKRINVKGRSKKKKYMQRSSGQGHFNSREPGKTTTSKRTDKVISSTFKNHLKGLLPYS